MHDLDLNSDNSLNVESFIYNNIAYYSLNDLGHPETMQKSGPYYHVSILPQNMKVVLRPSSAYYGIYKISEIKEMFKVEALERIFLTIEGVRMVMEAVSNDGRNILNNSNIN